MSKSQDKKREKQSVIISDELLIFNQVQRPINNYNICGEGTVYQVKGTIYEHSVHYNMFG